VTGLRHLPDHALGVGAFRDALDKGGLDLVAEMLFDRLAALIVLIGPAMVADRADIHEADLERLVSGLLGGRAGGEAEGERRAGGEGGTRFIA
jgi:hypothetical protein